MENYYNGKYQWLVIVILMSCLVSFIACDDAGKMMKPIMSEPEADVEQPEADVEQPEADVEQPEADVEQPEEGEPVLGDADKTETELPLPDDILE